MTLQRRAACATLVILSMLGPASAAARTPVKRAVLVGIDDYSASRFALPATPLPDRDWHDLDGATTDVDVMREMLVARHGFDAANIVTLENQAASREAILTALDAQLVAPSRAGDVVLFYFAGHGSQVRNTSSHEADKLDESIVPADSRAGAADIRDKELRRIFNRILDRSARLTVVLDSCHSGSGGRGLDAGLRPRGIAADLRDVADGRPAGPRPESRGALILAAAEDFDLAYETRDERGTIHGAFSWALARALRDADAGEPAIDTFLRAQALLRGETPAQEPVLAGDVSARLAPFLSDGHPVVRSAPHVSVEKAIGDGTYVLQGGWLNGLTVGSELHPLGNAAVTLEVTKLLGIARCEARATAAAPIAAGTLLEVKMWAVPPGRPLRVWIPESDMDVAGFAALIGREASRRGIRWVADPTATTPAYLIRWRNGWEIVHRGHVQPVAAASAPEIVANVPSGATLFVQLPAPTDIAKKIAGECSGRGVVIAQPETADYILAGRFVNGRSEYAWIRPAVTKVDRHRLALPLRSAWTVADRDAPLVLSDALLRLRRVFGWEHLESPPGGGLPYQLTIRNADGTSFEGGSLVGGRRYGLALRPAHGIVGSTTARYVYVFTIDSSGRSVLLFPPNGSVENRIAFDRAPHEIPLGAAPSFTVTPPYGVDTYFLLSTDEALPNPWALEWDGVRGAPPAPQSPLEALLASATGAMTRSPEAIRTPANWSIEKVVCESVPPHGESDDRRGSE